MADALTDMMLVVLSVRLAVTLIRQNGLLPQIERKRQHVVLHCALQHGYSTGVAESTRESLSALATCACQGCDDADQGFRPVVTRR